MNFRRNLLVSMALLTALTAPALAQKEAQLALPLSQTKPSELFRMLIDPASPGIFPAGITMISPDDENRRLLVQGTTEGVAKLREIIQLVDVKQKTLRLEARILLQNPAKGTDKPKQEIVGTATIHLTNNRQGDVVLVGEGQIFRIQITPHVNGDGTFTLSTDFAKTRSASQENGNVQRQETKMNTFRRISNGVATKVAVLGVGDEVPRYFRRGGSTDIEANVPAFILEVTPIATPGSRTTEKRQPVVVVKPSRKSGK